MKVRNSKFSSKNIQRYLKDKNKIFDIGSGPKGSYWWEFVDKDVEIIGIDSAFFPRKLPKNVRIYSMDANNLKKLTSNYTAVRYKPFLKRFILEKVDWTNKFDMVVANHVLEHVSSPEKVVEGVSKLIKKGGVVYVGFPDSRNFTDVFYHLIHAEGGGHIQKLTDKKVERFFKKYGFKLLEKNIWPDEWKWFENLYDYKGRGIKYITAKEINYIARVFRKELTYQKGYFYGWEMVFRKK